MTVSANLNRNDATGNGVATAYTYTFPIYATTELSVYVAGQLMVLGSDYTITGGVLPAAVGGTVNFTVAPANNAAVAIIRTAPFTQPYDPKDNATFSSQTGLEPQLDELTFQVQQIYERLNRSAQLKKWSTVSLGEGALPDPVASTVIGWNAGGTALALYTFTTNTAIGTPVVIGGTDQGKVSVINTGSTGYTTQDFIPFMGVLAGGTTNYTLSISPWSPAYDSGNFLMVRMPSTCAASPTLNISPNGGAALGAKNIVYQKYDGTFVNCAAADLLSGQDYIFKYSASQDKFIVLAPMVPSAFTSLKALQNMVAADLGKITGLVLTAAAGNTTLTIGAGTAMDSTGVQFITLGAFTKLLDATGTWTAGTGGKGNQAASAASTSYHIFLIGKTTDLTAADIFFDTSTTAANLAASAAGSAGFNLFRRIGSLKSDGSKNWVVTRSYEMGGGGLRFELDVPVRDFSTANPGTSAVVWTTAIPTGLKLVTECTFGALNAAATVRNILITSPDATDSVPTGSLRTFALPASAVIGYITARRMTSTTATLRYRADSSDANLTVEGFTIGWEDSRR